MSIAGNLDHIREKIQRAAEHSGRSGADITLIAVSKTVPVGRIQEAISAGVSQFGENRVQEATEKFARPNFPEPDKVTRAQIILHMIGTLQRNKARKAALLFDWLHSLDRPDLAFDLDRAVGDFRTSPLPVLIEVNLTGEPSKSGISQSDLTRLADALAACHHLHASGLMTIARQDADETELRHTFSTLRSLLENLRTSHPGSWQHLSMGMSDDYEIAIQEGATMVRLGRAIFGEREPVT
jgi:pyridoxal phosphate enzyme (YggS family)